MPRSKNPNPRQVMEGDEINTATGCGDPVDNEVCEAESLDAEPDVMNAFGDEDGRLNLRENTSPVDEQNIDANCDSLSDLATQNFLSYGDERVVTIERSNTPEEMFENSALVKSGASLDLSPTSPTSFFSRLSPSLAMLGDFAQNSLTTLRTSDTKKARNGTSPGLFNPKVMTWMRNRFQMRPGGRISASDVIALYRSDTEHLEDPPPGLQNYQVGQLLRRVFPNITRCKITVDGRRLWVYKHLNFVQNPPDDLFEERWSPMLDQEENGEGTTGHLLNQHYGTSDSPASNFDEGGIDGDDDLNNHSSPDPGNNANVDDGDRDKNNVILLGLLSKKIKSEPTSPRSMQENEASPKMLDIYAKSNGADLPKKKRDSEVIEWLRDNYKVKPGYYVKSMDLLRKYNNGRAEMVKYLSQVGRVMKHVFPSVRHLRKSFKGGKREWVYLNLKPVDVDSDSEEGRSMVMPAMRRSTGWYGTSSPDVLPSSSQRKALAWKQERVNITHAPLSLVQRSPNMVFKPRVNIFQSLSQSDGNKVIVRGKHNTAFKSVATRDSTSQSLSSQSSQGQQTGNKTRIILYNKKEVNPSERVSQDSGRMPTEIEKDIFAPFVKFNKNAGSTGQGETSGNSEKGANELAHTSNFKIHRITGNRGEVFGSAQDDAEDKTDTSNSFVIKLIEGNNSCNATKVVSDDMEENENEASFAGLDLSVKRVNQEIEGEEVEFNTMVNGNDPEVSELPEALNLTKSLDSEQLSSPPSTTSAAKVNMCSSQTIHYHPKTDLVQDNVKNTNVKPHCSIKLEQIVEKSLASHASATMNSQSRRQYLEMNTHQDDTPVSWQSLQTFNAQRYGWLRSPGTCNMTSRSNDSGGRRNPRFIEWFIFSGQWLVNKQRALREIKIYEDWTVVIHALGRRVYPNDLGGITDLEKTSASLNKVFRVLAEAKLCMGFPAPSVSDLYIHGILVSKFEVWSSREDSGEDIRQRAVNCQILYSGPNACCSKCARIMKLHQQQRRGAGLGKRSSSEPLTNHNFRPKQPKL